jgi:hypothetical protein
MPSIQLTDQFFTITSVSTCDLTVTAVTGSNIENLYAGMIGYAIGPAGTPASIRILIQTVVSPGVIRCRISTTPGTGVLGSSFDFATYTGGTINFEAQLANVDFEAQLANVAGLADNAADLEAVAALYAAGATVLAAPVVSLIMSASDLSVASHSQWVPRTDGAGSAVFGVGWTDVNNPRGVWCVEEADNGLAVSGAIVLPLPSTQPDGSAASTLYTVRNTAAAFSRLVYTPTSGGTGDVLTDSTGVAGTHPTLTWGPALASSAEERIVYEEDFSAATILVPQFTAHSDREYTFEGCVTDGTNGNVAYVIVNGATTGCKTYWIKDDWTIYAAGNPFAGLLLCQTMVGNNFSMRGKLHRWNGIESQWEFASTRADGMSNILRMEFAAGCTVKPTSLSLIATGALTGHITVTEKELG